MGATNRVGKGLSDRPARLHRLAESIPGLLKVLKYRLCRPSTFLLTTDVIRDQRQPDEIQDEILENYP
jgi:hypothetical protein